MAKDQKEQTAAADQVERSIEMVALGGFECEAYEGRVKAGQAFTTSPARADHLERLGAARRK